MSNVVKFSDHQSFFAKLKTSMLYVDDKNVEEVGKILQDPNPDPADLKRLQEIASGPAIQRKVLKHV